MEINNLLQLFNAEIADDSPKFILYTSKITPRLEYVCKFIFCHGLNANYKITTSVNEFNKSDFFKINYSENDFDNSFKITPHTFLFEAGVNYSQFFIDKEDSKKYFFKNKSGVLKHDIFAGIFWHISRVEEWQNVVKDKHERFEAENSFAYKNSFLKRALVDEWLLELKKELEFFFNDLKFRKREFKKIITVDVDNLFAYKHKGLIRTIGAFIKDIYKLKGKNFYKRLRVVLLREEDPFDIYVNLLLKANEYNIPLFYFFLFNTGNKFDRTISPKHKSFKKVFLTLKNNKANFGVHPSYYTLDNHNLLKKEIENFNVAIKSDVKISRQHYLRFNIKTTPKQLLSNGIFADFTMGYASKVGFRASCSIPFYYYDFENETELNILAVPFCAMDGAYSVYKPFNYNEARADLVQLKEYLESLKGNFITVFHERSVSELGFEEKKLFESIYF
ncbi:MAG: hypothetical protein JSU07_13210 [Bacteroidetes bacterium]|nr:hypothetical protein [Bacteroidota bacterium]